MNATNYPFSTPGYLKYKIQVEEKKAFLIGNKFYLVYKQYDNGTEDVFECFKGDLRLYITDHYPDAADSQIDDMFDALYYSEETLAIMIQNGYISELEVCDEN